MDGATESSAGPLLLARCTCGIGLRRTGNLGAFAAGLPAILATTPVTPATRRTRRKPSEVFILCNRNIPDLRLVAHAGDHRRLDRNAHRRGDERRQGSLATLFGVNLRNTLGTRLVPVKIPVTPEVVLAPVAAEFAIAAPVAPLTMLLVALLRMALLFRPGLEFVPRLLTVLAVEARLLRGLWRTEGEAVHDGAFKLVIAVEVLGILDPAAHGGLLGLELLLLRRRDQPEVMLCMLQIAFRRHRITRGMGIARQLYIFFRDMRGGAANLHIGTVGFVGTRQRIGTAPIIAAPHALVLSRSH